MTEGTTARPTLSASRMSLALGQWLPRLEAVVIPLAALVAGLAVFSVFLLALGKSPVDFYALIYKAGFSSAFSWQNTLSRVSPLLFAGLCVALPARLGLVVIGGEGAIALGGLAAAVTGLAFGWAPAILGFAAMGAAAMIVGGAWIGAVGWLRIRRGVNETISSLLMAYIAIAVMKGIISIVLGFQRAMKA